jgi:hypothetical protein
MGKKRSKGKNKRSKRINFGGEPEELPTMLQRMYEGLSSIHGLLQRASGDYGRADALVLQDLCELTKQLEDLASPYDAFDVLECVRLFNSMMDPDSYKESEFEGSAESIEFCALIMASRSSREGSAPPEDGHRASPDVVMDEIMDLLVQLRRRVSDHVFLKASIDHKIDSDLYFRAALKEVHLRMPTYPHMMEDSLTELFADPDLESECRKSLGFTGLEAIDVLKAIVELYATNWNNRLQSLSEANGLVQTAFDEYVAGGEIDPEIREYARSLWQETWSDYADGTVTKTADLAAHCALPETVVEAVVDAFALDMPGDPAETVMMAFANGQSAIRLRPLIRGPSGEFAFVHNALLIPSLRENIEAQLKPTAAWATYDKRRASFLEFAAARYLTAIFPTADVTNSIEYFVPDPKSGKPETTPSAYSKLVESDSLFVIDDVAIIVEAKAGSISEGTRTGDPVKVNRDLKKLIADANDQAQRIRECIKRDGGLQLRGGTWRDLSFVRETYVITVTLEDFSNVTAMTSELEAKGLIASIEHPWITSLHDLRIVSESIERPSVFLLFLRRRTDPRVTKKFRAIEELDYFMAFLNGKLYVEPDPSVMESELPQFGKARVADKRRFANQPIEIFPSLTDPLDAWYFTELGIRTSAAPKPRMRAEPILLELVDKIAEAHESGWLRIGATILNANSASQKRMVNWIQMLNDATKHDGNWHSATIPGGSNFADSFVLTIATRGVSEAVMDACIRLKEYTYAKKHQLKVAMGAGILLEAGEDLSLLCANYDTSPFEDDPALDEMIRLAGLKPAESVATMPASWQRKKRGRTGN